MADSREQLLGWIAGTKRIQRTLAIVVGTLAALSLALSLWRKPIGTAGFLITVVVAAIGFWVTTSHLNEWNGRLSARDRR